MNKEEKLVSEACHGETSDHGHQTLDQMDINGVDYWDAWKAVEEIIDGRPVDLIDIDMASKSLIRAIERYGVEL